MRTVPSNWTINQTANTIQTTMKTLLNQDKVQEALAVVNWSEAFKRAHEFCDEQVPGFAWLNVVTGVLEFAETGAEIDGLIVLNVYEDSEEVQFEIASWVKVIAPERCDIINQFGCEYAALKEFEANNA